MFVDIKMFILESLATDNDQQSYQRLRKRLNARVLDIMRIIMWTR